MKLQLDTKNKTISLDENVKLGDLTKLLEELLPNNRWAEFTLVPQSITNWAPNPIIIDRYPQPSTYPQPNQPYWQPWITYGGDGTSELVPNNLNYNFTAGVYNLEVKKTNGKNI